MGTQFMQLVASDYQEAKNINTESESPFPNRGSRGSGPRRRPADGHVGDAGEGTLRLEARQKLLVVANDNVQISSVGFFDGQRQIGRVQKNTAGLYEKVAWRTSSKRKGAHVLTAVASDVRGREGQAAQTIRVCK